MLAQAQSGAILWGILQKQTRVLTAAFMTMFLDLLGFGIIIPVQPYLAQDLGASPTAVTWLGAAYSAMQFFFAPFWGSLSDRIGRKPVLMISIFIGSVGHLIFAMSDVLYLLFIARLLAGFGNANLGTAQALISDTTTPANRARGMGLIGAAFGLGFILGPVIGAFLAQWGPSTPAFVAAGLGLVNLAFASVFLPETHPKEARSTSLQRRSRWQDLKLLNTLPNVPLLVFVFLIVAIAMGLMEQSIPLLIADLWVPKDGGSHALLVQGPRLVAYYLLAVGITMTIVQGGLVGPIQKMFAEKKLLFGASLAVALGFGLIPVAAGLDSFAFLIASGCVLALGSGLFNPTCVAAISRAAGPDVQGQVLGLNQSFGSLGRVIGPLAAGPLFELGPNLPFLAAAGLVLLSLGATSALRLSPRH